MYKKGDIIKCTVTGFKDYGIFVKIDNNYTGLIHISEICEAFVRNVTDYAELQEEIYAKILEVDDNIKQLKLTIKDLNYKVDGNDIHEIDKNGFLPLKNNLNIWLNEKITEINKQRNKI